MNSQIERNTAKARIATRVVRVMDSIKVARLMVPIRTDLITDRITDIRTDHTTDRTMDPTDSTRTDLITDIRTGHIMDRATDHITMGNTSRMARIMDSIRMVPIRTGLTTDRAMERQRAENRKVAMERQPVDIRVEKTGNLPREKQEEELFL